jgi:uncharacterized membrane protein YgcG
MPAQEISTGAVRVAAGESFTASQQHNVEQALTTAMRETGMYFSVFAGDVDGDVREMAERMHAALGERSRDTVLVLAAPRARRLEIVTGDTARERLPDRACDLATLSMITSFAGGDLAGGLVTGVRMLAEAAGRNPDR